MVILRTVLPSKMAHTDSLEFSNTEYTSLEKRKATVEESMINTSAVDWRILTAVSPALDKVTWNISVVSTIVSKLMAMLMQLTGMVVSNS